MRKLQIAIIDDGINEKLYTTGELEHNIQITAEGHIEQRTGYDAYKPSHGTTCAAIIKKYSPDACLSSVKILGDLCKGTRVQLIKALQWCADNKINLVNLSLGTINYRDFKDIEETVSYASQNGVAIVAACNNRNVFTCPASLSDVIGVKCDRSQVLQGREFTCNLPALDGIDITACGSHELRAHNGKSRITSACNSFAAPAVTSIVYDILSNDPGICIHGIKEQLKEKSCNPYQISINKPESNMYSYGYINKNTDIPILTLRNYGSSQCNELAEQLTQKFRADGYNAISIGGEAEENLCAGIVSAKSYMGHKKDCPGENLKVILDIFDPDIILMAIDMEQNGEPPSYLKEIEFFFEVDIKINLDSYSSVEIISPDETFRYDAFIFNDKSIDDLYNCIVNLYDR